ncbi:hypothetical protein Tco_1057607 [Tanacetum coccineum]|uniref:Uncharacterized protein n=1 Tax=Tanacetum coccineum TaxID=301880 RepID=A0ABQ5H7I2_9ASTR
MEWRLRVLGRICASLADFSCLSVHWSSWPFKSRSLSRKAQIDNGCECPPRLEHVISGDIRQVYDFLWIPQLIDKFNKSIRSWRRREGPVVVDWRDLKSVSECVFSEIKPLLVQLTLIAPDFTVKANSIPELLNINKQIAVAVPNWQLRYAWMLLFIMYRTVVPIAGACSSSRIDLHPVTIQKNEHAETTSEWLNVLPAEGIATLVVTVFREDAINGASSSIVVDTDGPVRGHGPGSCCYFSNRILTIPGGLLYSSTEVDNNISILYLWWYIWNSRSRIGYEPELIGPGRTGSLMVPKFQVVKRRSHNHDLCLELESNAKDDLYGTAFVDRHRWEVWKVGIPTVGLGSLVLAQAMSEFR